LAKKDTVILERRFVPKDSVIIREGDVGSQAFLVQSGSVRVFVTGDENKEIELAKLGVGQIFGEMALIHDGPRMASVVAMEDCNLIVISRQQFMDKLESTDPTIRAVVHMLTLRMMEANNTLINKKSSIEDLKETVRIIYQNVSGSLPRNQLRTFQNTVLPKLDELMEAIEGFQDRYGNDT